MDRYAVRYKKVGETPLQVLEAYRKETNLPKEIPLSYAGRLDPMAEGELLILIGDECKHQKKYTSLDKEYEVEVLFGFSTDTGDALGICKEGCGDVLIEKSKLVATLNTLKGKNHFSYPVFSSKTVKGKPLFLWALEERLSEIDIPKIDVELYTLKLLSLRKVSSSDVQNYIQNKIETIPKISEESKRLGADFRRDSIRSRWKEVFDECDDGKQFYIATIRCVCSSGTYMRTLAEVIGKKLHTPSLSYSIKRTKIGRYRRLVGPFAYWSKRYR